MWAIEKRLSLGRFTDTGLSLSCPLFHIPFLSRPFQHPPFLTTCAGIIVTHARWWTALAFAPSAPRCATRITTSLMPSLVPFSATVAPKTTEVVSP